MKVAIVGSGKVGSALGKWAAETGHIVCFTSRELDHARRAAKEAGHDASAAELEPAVQASEVVLLTLPFTQVKPTLARVRSALSGKIVVDVTNPLTEDHRDLSVGHTDSGAEQIARAFPEARVVKAFNAVFAEVYARAEARLGGERVAIFSAGDDRAAKEQVASLIASLGFEPIDAGPLRNSRFLEPLSLLNIHLGRVLGNGTLIGFALARENPAPSRE
jgi:NADPH-dependent F420 reductase